MAKIFYPGIIKFDGRFFKVVFQDWPDYESDAYTTVEEAIHFSESGFSQHVQSRLQKGLELPSPTSVAGINIDSDEFARILVPFDADKTRSGADNALFVGIREMATLREVEDTKLLSNTEKELLDHHVDVSDNVNSFIFFRKLMALTDIVKKNMHKEIKQRHTDSNWKKLGRWFLPKFKPFTDYNWDISVDVYDRLLLRYALLRDAERLERRYNVHSSISDKSKNTEISFGTDNQELNRIRPNSSRIDSSSYKSIEPDKSNMDKSKNPDLRAYKLATTDVFVEKAIAYLELDSNSYRLYGRFAYVLASITIFAGLYISFKSTFPQGISASSDILSKAGAVVSLDWKIVFMNFSRAFTFYGMLVLMSVGFWRYGKAMLDQAERLRERRHALRQGRLFVHLNDGELELDQLEKAFAWNMTKGNAFGDMQTEASAPWGSLFKDALKTIKETFGSRSN